MNFEPKDTGEPRGMLLVIVLMIILCLEVFVGLLKVVKTIEETPKETVKFINTEFNP